MRWQHERVGGVVGAPFQIAREHAGPGHLLGNAERLRLRNERGLPADLVRPRHHEPQSRVAVRDARERGEQHVAALLWMQAAQE